MPLAPAAPARPFARVAHTPQAPQYLSTCHRTGAAGTDYAYNPAGLSAGDTLRFALQHDATSLSTGRYDYSVLLTADYTSSTTTRTFTGSYDVVNRSAATHPFGVGWQLEGLDKLVSGTGGMLWVKATTPRPIS